MSLMLMVKALQTKVGNPLRKLVLIKLADNANDKGECWPSYQHIADQCEISRRSVINHIKALEDDGLLIKQSRPGTFKANASNIYIIKLDGANPAHGESPAPSHSAGAASCSESPALPPSAGAAPRTSHSLEPVNEPKEPVCVFTESFETFWKLYPKKVNKKKALGLWLKLKPSSELISTIMSSLGKYCVSEGWAKDGGRFVPHASTWINAERWNDEVVLAGSTPEYMAKHTGFDNKDYTAGLYEEDDHGSKF